MPRSSFAEARNTREAILDRAVEVASRDGLEGLTFGRLAGDLNLSKAGLVGHFNTKADLQRATLDRAVEVFRERVIDPAERLPPGMPRLVKFASTWSAYIDEPVFPGGCFVSAASFEFDDRPGEVRESIVEMEKGWRAKLTREARAAVEAGDLPPDADPRQVAFELMGVALGAVQARQLLGDRQAARRCRAAMLRVLGR